jgi:hypothetical protein
VDLQTAYDPRHRLLPDWTILVMRLTPQGGMNEKYQPVDVYRPL